MAKEVEGLGEHLEEYLEETHIRESSASLVLEDLEDLTCTHLNLKETIVTAVEIAVMIAIKNKCTSRMRWTF